VTGVYRIVNLVNGKMYVGQSVDIKSRWAKHRCQLNKGVHANIHLQRAWDKYGADSFKFEVAQIADKDQLDVIEESEVNAVGLENVYNLSKNFTSSAGELNSFYGKKHSEDSKHKMSLWKKKNYLGSANPNYGKKNTKESCTKMSEGRSSLKKEDVLRIVDLLKSGTSNKEIANIFRTSVGIIRKIANGSRWTNVTGGPVIARTYDENGKRVWSEAEKKSMGDRRRGCKHTEETKQIMRQKTLIRNGGVSSE